MTYYGYTGKRLDIDLTNQTWTISQLSEEILAHYVGGKGLAAHILYTEVAAGIDPLSPENYLIFATGPLTGTLAPLSGRMIVATKSPQTGIWVDSNAGGFFGPELKKAGFDVVILKGKAAAPVTVLVDNGEVSFRPADELWGLDTEETHKRLKAQLGGEDYRVACIGPAGEKLVPMSAIITEMRAFGRAGVGTVMGSKNVKAFVAHGNQTVKIFDPEEFYLNNIEAYNEIAIHPDTGGGRQRFGTNVIYSAMNELGIHPVKNFQSSINEHAEALSEDHMREDLVEKDKACYGCPIACSKYAKVKKGKFKGEYSEGPEYEDTWGFGAQCGNGDYGAVIAAEHLCDLYGIDSISTGNTIGFAMECLQRGIITLEEVGYDLSFGNTDSMIKMVHQIGKAEGLGKILGKGTKAAAAIFGKGSEKFAMHVKGLEIPAYDSRAAYAMGLAYATSDRGGCHLRSWPIAMEALQNRGRYDPYSIEFKAEYVKNEQDLISIVDSAGLCIFATFALNARQLVRLLYSVTGFTAFRETDEVLETGERIYNLTRLYNQREGVEKDTLPQRLLEEKMPDGPAKGNLTPLSEMLAEYYLIRGWDEEGSPSEAKLKELGLD
ncbi:MAG: aldehyde ferredoxin oxidoreductase family protein [Desulfitobacteriaceae bacterium]